MLNLTPALKKSIEDGQKFGKQLQEAEQEKERIAELGNSIRDSLKKQQSDKIARQEKELILQEHGNALQEEGNTESKKQTELAEKALRCSKWGIGIGIAAGLIAFVSLLISAIAMLFSALSFLFK